MRTIPLVFGLLLLVAFSYTRVFAQGSSSKGTEFWTAYMDHVNGVSGMTPCNMVLYITSDVSTSGSVSFTDGTAAIPFSVTANEVTFVTIPQSQFLASEGQFNKGIHITSQKPIAVYAHIYANSVSGATLLLPVNTLGKSYYSLNYTQISNSLPTSESYSSFVVIATEDATTVEITPTALLTSNKAAGTPFTVTLNKGEVYQGLSLTDLTGTKIRSISTASQPCKKIAVFSGSTKLAIGCIDTKVKPNANNLSADNLFQQVYPTATWGKNYITVSLKNRFYDIYRIVLSDPNTVVTVNGNLVSTGQFKNNIYDFTSTGVASNVIVADKPIQLVQYTPTQRQQLNVCPTPSNPPTEVGDPEMIFLNPIEQGLDHVTLYSTGYYTIQQSYINVVIPTKAVASFTIDGASYSSSFKTVTGNTDYSFAQISVSSGPQAAAGKGGSVTSGTHNLKADLPFNAIAYGFGNAESYGYAAGTDLKNLNEFIELEDNSTNTTVSQGCAGVSYTPRLSIPYKTQKITWDFKDGSAPVAVSNPAIVKQTTKGDQTLYTYQCPTPVKYSNPGNYSIVATVLNPTSDDCGSNEDIEFDYTISEVPNAQFKTSVKQTGACPGEEIAFTDATDPGAVGIKSWSWDFADAANSTASNPNNVTNQNPKHTFTKPGDYTVYFTVENQNGCSTTAQQTIHVNKAPKAAFTVSNPDCETQDVTFTDGSAANEGTLTSWLWDFGDSTAVINQPNNAAFTHRFKKAGTYHVSLTVTSSTGCSTTVITDVAINPLPMAEFTPPDVCISDAFAQFSNTSSIADNTALSYSWDFGDKNASLAANTSTDKNPKHTYTATGTYTATLTVTSKYNCQTTVKHTFTVNGSTPKALFDTKNVGNTFCSSDDVLFKNTSTVDFGAITKIEWYFDFDRQPGVVTVYTKDVFPANNIFPHKYPLFSDQPSKSYHIRMVVYSGGICSNVFDDNIVLYANPVINVAAIGPLCQEASPVQIKAEPQNGVVGTGVFSGTGVSALGLFNPAKSGPGSFTINYLFTTQATGCTYGYSQLVTVYPTPTASAGPDLHVLQGGNITINASAGGDKPLTYKWTMANGSPAVGLDHDNVLTPIATPTDDVDYMLTVTSANGCTKSSVVHISVLKAPVVPNTFTPNGDGYNDRWEIKYLDTYPNCTIEVYNRLGEKLYSSVGYAVPWDGTYQGAALPTGTYYYIINPKNGRKVISGSITIIR